MILKFAKKEKAWFVTTEDNPRPMFGRDLNYIRLSSVSEVKLTEKQLKPLYYPIAHVSKASEFFQVKLSFCV